jgi:UDP-3-O-acyl-N-acetylglucosamine deacetylase
VGSAANADARTLTGTAAHSGAATRVTLARRDGPIRFVRGGARAGLAELRVVATNRGVLVATTDGRVRVDVVEHLFAAFAGLGVRSGVEVEVDGDELPLLDGGSAAYCDALAAIGAPAGAPPTLVVARAATLGAGSATYDFAPGDDVSVEATVAFRAPVGRARARWSGGSAEFVTRIAPARTFVWRDEVDALRASGRALGDVGEAAIVFDDRGPMTGALRGDDEPARHKLLDLIGDLGFYGGPPRGVVRATRPGHGATHAVVARALAAGVLRRLAPSAVAFVAACAVASPARADVDEQISAPSPPTLQALVHEGLAVNLGLTGATMVPSPGPDGAPTARSYAWFLHAEAEQPFIGRSWYVGLEEDVAGGAVPGVGASDFVSSPELWIRGIWFGRLGLSSGGGLGLVVPTPRDLDAATQRVLDAVRVARPWDEALFDPLTLTVRPWFDVRHVTGRVILQLRQGLDVSVALKSSAAFQEGAAFTAIGGFYTGVRVTPWLGVGLELWETYAITAEVSDDARAAFSLSPSVRIMTPGFEPAFSVVLPISTPLRGAAQSYAAARIDLSLRFDPAPAR